MFDDVGSVDLLSQGHFYSNQFFVLFSGIMSLVVVFGCVIRACSTFFLNGCFSTVLREDFQK